MFTFVTASPRLLDNKKGQEDGMKAEKAQDDVERKASLWTDTLNEKKKNDPSYRILPLLVLQHLSCLIFQSYGFLVSKCTTSRKIFLISSLNCKLFF